MSIETVGANLDTDGSLSDPYLRIRSILDGVSAADNLSEAVQLALGEVCGILGLETGWVYLLDEATGEPLLAAQRLLPPVFEVQPERWQGLCGCVHSLLNGEQSLTENVDVYRCSRLWGVESDNPLGLKYHVCIPFMLHGRPVGIMNVARADSRPLDPAPALLLEVIGRLMGLAVERARLLNLKSESVIKAERERIARELHDTLMQGLTGITLQLETADALMDADEGVARRRVVRALEIAQETMAETRAAIDDLGSVGLGNQSLADAITRAVNDFATESPLQVTLEMKLSRDRLASQLETALLRIVREGLQNVVRHADATQVRIVARQTKQRLTLIMADDGRGFDASNVSASVHGYGLASMRRRVQLLNGRFRLITAVGKGTRVEITIPLSPAG